MGAVFDHETVALADDWQGGPAHVEIDYDVYEKGPILILRVSTAAELGAGERCLELLLGAGQFKIELPSDVTGRLDFSVAAYLPEARALLDALTRCVAAMEAPETTCAACQGDPEAHDQHVCGKDDFA